MLSPAEKEIRNLQEELDLQTSVLVRMRESFNLKQCEYLQYRNDLGIDNPALEEWEIETLGADNDLNFMLFEYQNLELDVIDLERWIQNLQCRIQSAG